MSLIDIDFPYKSITIDLSNVIGYYRLLSEKIVVVLQVNHRHNVVCMVFQLSQHAIGSSRQRWNEWRCKNILKRQKTNWDELD